MAAISGIALTQLNQGDRVVASNRLYGRTTQLFAQEFSRFAVQATFVDFDEIVIGTRLLRDYRLRVDFPARTVVIEKA